MNLVSVWRDTLLFNIADFADFAVDFVADFADDGVLGGDGDKVLEVLKREIELGPEYGSKFNFSKMVVYPVAGQLFDGELEGYRQLGIKVDISGMGSCMDEIQEKLDMINASFPIYVSRQCLHVAEVQNIGLSGQSLESG